MASIALKDISGEAAKSDADFSISEGSLDVSIRAAVARMAQWCARQTQATQFLARGFVVDSVGDISQQVRDYFPSHIDVRPILDDMTFVIGEQAKKSGQRFQEVILEFIGDGKIPEAARANIQTFVKWYGLDSVADGGDFEGHHKKLKPGWSGGAGGSGADMLKYLNLASKKGFLLQVCALDINDARGKALLGDMPIMQAFGASPEALQSATQAVGERTAQADTVKAVAEALVEIKTLKAALNDAGDTPKAGPLAAALAHRSEVLASTLPTLQANAPAAVKAESARILDGAKIDLQARQMAVAITALTQTPLMPTPISPAIRQAVASIQHVTQSAAMPVRDAIVLTLKGDAPPAMQDAVRQITQIMAKPEFLPMIEAAAPPAAAIAIRQAVTQPVFQGSISKPVEIAPVIAQIKAATAQAAPDSPVLPTLRAATQVLEQAAASPPALRAPILQSVSDNLQASLQVKGFVPPALQTPLMTVNAQVDAAVAQSRIIPMPLPSVPAPLPPQSPLAVVAQAVGVVPAQSIPPSTLARVAPTHDFSAPLQGSPFSKGGFDTAALSNPASQPVVVVAANPANGSVTGKPTKNEPDNKDKPKGSGRCAGCFNKSCAACHAFTDAAVAQMNTAMSDYAKKKQLNPKVA